MAEARPPILLDDETERLPLKGEDDEWWLVVVEGGVSVAHRLPRGRPLDIGRSGDADVCIEHASISRQHAQIVVGPPVRIQDLGSANGVRIGRRVLEPHVLTPVEPGQAIELGAVLAVLHRPSMLPSGTVQRRAEDAGADRPSTLPDGPMLVRDPTMQQVMDLVSRVAPSELSVLLTGETGVGKEVIAQAVHDDSRRADERFLRVNCAALAESLAESELFGHAKGAFTGAQAARAGLFEAADGGTLMLDEVGELTPGMQAKLLRVLETREVRRIGSTESRRIDVRFVSATNRDLREEIRAGRFREDLFFRLNGIEIEIPALRDRPLDILPLAERFARGAARGGSRPVFSPRTARALEAYRWPGNVRELRNAVERAVVLARGAVIEPADLPASLTNARAPALSPSSDLDLRDEVGALERQRILEALEQTGANQTKAAALLGMPRRTFVKRLDQYGIERPRKGKKT